MATRRTVTKNLTLKSQAIATAAALSGIRLSLITGAYAMAKKDVTLNAKEREARHSTRQPTGRAGSAKLAAAAAFLPFPLSSLFYYSQATRAASANNSLHCDVQLFFTVV
jgi:uncharacterized MAPEG superfamily protein